MQIQTRSKATIQLVMTLASEVSLALKRESVRDSIRKNQHADPSKKTIGEHTGRGKITGKTLAARQPPECPGFVSPG